MVIGIPELSLNNNVWIFQGNPKYYDFFSEFHDESITEGWWTVTNNKEQIIKGDIGLIWISGSDAGIYAIIEILNKPEYREDSEKLKKYWNIPSDAANKEWRVQYKYIIKLKKPILKKEIILIDSLKDLTIIKAPQGTNFLVTREEWLNLRHLISENLKNSEILEQDKFGDIIEEDSYSTNSWRYEPPNVTIKTLDKSAILYGGTVIPAKLRDFFGIENVHYGDKKAVELEYQNKKYQAYFTARKYDSTTLQWYDNFRSIIQRKYPNFTKFFINNEEYVENCPQMKITKHTEKNHFFIDFLGEDKTDSNLSVSDSIIFAQIGWSDNGWQGFDEESSQKSQNSGFRYIKEEGISHEWWNFFDYGDDFYYGWIQFRGNSLQFNQNGLVLFSSINPDTKKYYLIGFYGATEYGNFHVPINPIDTIHDSSIKEKYQDKYAEFSAAGWKAKKELSTIFYQPLEFNLEEINQTQWGQSAYLYVGDGKAIPKLNVQILLEKVIDTHTSLLDESSETSSIEIRTVIEKTKKVLSHYFSSTPGNKNYWRIAPGRKGVLWNIWKNDKICSIGYHQYEPYLDELIQIKDKNLFYNRLIEIAKEHNGSEDFSFMLSSQPGTHQNTIWSFFHEMKPGDIVIASTGKSQIYGIGTITSDISSRRTEDFTQIRNVRWDYVDLNTSIPQGVPGNFSITLNKLKVDDYLKIISSIQNETGQIIENKIEIKPKFPTQQFKKQVILYGPPGTGKTYSSVLRAHEIIYGYHDPNVTFSLLHKRLKEQNKEEFDYSQTTWLDAIILAFGEIGPDQQVSVDEIKESDIIKKVSTYKNTQSISKTIAIYLQRESKIDSETVYVKNKTGREFFDKAPNSNWYLTEKGSEYLQLLKKDTNRLSETSSSQFNFITFHQSFAYEDFIEGIRPELNESGESTISYQIKDGIFKDICKKAALDPNNNYVLIIDEINRGNISKIFGELITLLEDNKRAGEAEEITVKLPYSGQEFSVPTNVYIIGTMNSTDKSIALVDIALRRRFHFERLNVDYKLIKNQIARKLLQELNRVICAIKNPDYEIGHYYFMNIPEQDLDNIELQKVFETRILPLLEEYFFNDWEALATILGKESIKVDKKKKLVWDEDTGKFEDESGDTDFIYGLSIRDVSIVFENTMKNFGIYQQETNLSE